MNYYNMKINDKFLDSVMTGVKTHEFRLNNAFNNNIIIGDKLVLISTTVANHLVKVTIKSIMKYKTWEEAISSNWNDFKDVFIDIPAALKECSMFYSKESVIRNGIICFGIELDKDQSKL
ncbi:MAG: ASCH domain-containing protein [Bacilli bacterium]